MKTQIQIINELALHHGADAYYKVGIGNKYVMTDGIKHLCELCQSYWLLDIVWSVFSKMKKNGFQVWNIVKNENDTAIVTCTDGTDNVLYKQNIPFTDFPLDSYSFYCTLGSIDGVNEIFVIMLKSEY